MSCPAILDAAFLASTLAHIDCQAATIGQQGYLALAATGSPIQVVLGVALTLFIALFGYRLLLGETPSVRDGVIAVVKVGAVLVLATSWPAFQILAYDVALKAPGDLAVSIASSSGLPSGNGLVDQLQGLDNEMLELGLLGAGQPPNATEAPSAASQLNQARADAQVPLQRYQPRWDPARDASLIGTARTTFLTATIGAFAAARLTAGLALALGPLFMLLLLFNATRSFVEGWVRVLAGAALGALAVTLVTAVEVALVGPWLTSTLELRYQNVATPGVPVELLVLSLVFGLTLLAALAGAMRLAHAFRFAPIVEHLRAEAERLARVETVSTSRSAQGASSIISGNRPRALEIADAVASSQRREGLGGRRAIGVRDREPASVAAPADGMAASSVPLGQRFRRRTQQRVSAGARRRDMPA
jgi:type IV secretion system protein VirB6